MTIQPLDPKNPGGELAIGDGKFMKVQLAIQGGGAKFVSLLAVLDAIQKCEKIEVTRVAGTSAGAIIAGLLAAKVPVSDVVAALVGNEGRKIAEAFSTPTFRSLGWRCLFRKRPHWDDSPLRNLLNQFIDPGTTFDQLRNRTGIRLKVLSVHLDTRYKHTHEGSEKVNDSIIDSCSLPFLFRIWDSQNQSVKLDGGLCDNLPVSELIDEEAAYGPVIALTFAPQPADHGRPKSLVSFLGAIIDTVINHPVVSTRKLLPESCIHSVDSDLHYLDFQTAMSDEYLRGRKYSDTREKASAFFKSYLNAAERNLVGLGDDPWCSDNPLAIRLMERINTHRMASLTSNSIVRISSRQEFTLHSLRDTTSPDEIVSQLEFEVRVNPLSVYSFGVNLCVQHDPKKPNGKLHGDSVEWRVLHDGIPITSPNNGGATVTSVTWLPALEFVENQDLSQRELIRRVLLLFDPPLPVSDKPYKLEVVYLITDCLPKLQTPDGDQLRYVASQGGVPKAEVVVYLPEEKADRYLVMSSDKNPPESTFLSSAVTKENFPIKKRFTGYAVRTENLDKGGCVALKLLRKHSSF